MKKLSTIYLMNRSRLNNNNINILELIIGYVLLRNELICKAIQQV